MIKYCPHCTAPVADRGTDVRCSHCNARYYVIEVLPPKTKEKYEEECPHDSTTTDGVLIECRDCGKHWEKIV